MMYGVAKAATPAGVEADEFEYTYRGLVPDIHEE